MRQNNEILGWINIPNSSTINFQSIHDIKSLLTVLQPNLEQLSVLLLTEVKVACQDEPDRLPSTLLHDLLTWPVICPLWQTYQKGNCISIIYKHETCSMTIIYIPKTWPAKKQQQQRQHRLLGRLLSQTPSSLQSSPTPASAQSCAQAVSYTLQSTLLHSKGVTLTTSHTDWSFLTRLVSNS